MTWLTFDHTDIVGSVSNGEGHGILVLLHQVNHTFLQRQTHTRVGGDMLKCYCLLFNKYTMCHLVILPACVPLGEGGGRGDKWKERQWEGKRREERREKGRFRGK